MELRQQTLEQCWVGAKLPRPRLSFLRLPSAIRRQIYVDAGFPSGCYISFPIASNESIETETAQVALSLMLTCRTIYSEVLQILFADNVFTAALHRPGFLYRLRQSAGKIRVMRRLLIHARPDEKRNQSLLCCHRGAVASLPEQRPACQDHHHTRPHTRQNFLDFRETLKLVLANAQPGTLELGLSLFAGNDIELADWLLSPLLDKEAPLLAECAIDLGTGYKADRADLIHKYTTQSVIKPTNTAPRVPFRFADLPPELRRLVLSFMDIVVPGERIEWLPSGAWSMHIDPEHDLGCRHDMLNWGMFPDGPCLHHGFFCAFWGSGRSQYCCCWGPPVAILLVSRWLYREAMSVFLQMNTFVSTPDWASDLKQAAAQFEDPAAPLRRVLSNTYAIRVRSTVP